MEEDSRERRFRGALFVVLVSGMLWRLAYLWLQPGSDPNFGRPLLDGAYYLDWARDLASGGSGPPGAYYLAPLYPYFLSLVLRGADDGFALIFMLQHLMSVAGVALVASAARNSIGRPAALAATALYLLHQPLLFFASRPLSETLALFLLFAALASSFGDRPRSLALAGLLAGLAVLARPGLLLVPVVWIVLLAVQRRFRELGLLAAGLALVVLPVTVRNLTVSGHPVLVSSNAGLTFYHGNGPGARGVFTPPADHPSLRNAPFALQRELATRAAIELSGRKLDDVEADGWWGRRALTYRASTPGETAGLLLRRVMLFLDNHEIGLDYDPLLDANPLRPTLRPGDELEVALVPFALLLGLAGAAVAGIGLRRSGGWQLWGALVAAAATPLLFYVSSRYRLPVAALLTLPAGCGLVALSGIGRTLERPRRVRAALVAVALIAVSLLVPSGAVRRETRAGALSNRALAYLETGDPTAAGRDSLRSIELSPRSARLRLNRGVVLEALGRRAEAETEFRQALELEPTLGEAAVGLSGILFAAGQHREAVTLLEPLLTRVPGCTGCWANMIANLVALQDGGGARRVAQRAEAAGIMLDPGLLDIVRQMPPNLGEESTEP